MPAASMRRRPCTPLAIAAALELIQALELRAVGRDDHLAAALERDRPAFAVLIHLACAFDAEPRLQRAGHVVDARVDHARVVARLVGADLALALEHADAGLRVARKQLAGHGEADDAAADDREVAALGRRARGCGGGRHPAQASPATAPGPPGAVAAAASISPAP
jgi:hypothetical protein